jgi:hypothetical protein
LCLLIKYIRQNKNEEAKAEHARLGEEHLDAIIEHSTQALHAQQSRALGDLVPSHLFTTPTRLRIPKVTWMMHLMKMKLKVVKMISARCWNSQQQRKAGVAPQDDNDGKGVKSERRRG